MFKWNFLNILLLKLSRLTSQCMSAPNTPEGLKTFFTFFSTWSISQVPLKLHTLTQWKYTHLREPLCCSHTLSPAQTDGHKLQNRSKQTSWWWWWWGGDSDEHDMSSPGGVSTCCRVFLFVSLLLKRSRTSPRGGDWQTEISSQGEIKVRLG